MTVGFAFTDGLGGPDVLLIHKKRGPAVVRDKLNGVGGHLKEGETPVECMVREFEEEAGVHIPADRWTEAVRMSGPHGDGWEVTFFFAHLEPEEAVQARTMEDEHVAWYTTNSMWSLRYPACVVSNLRWLVPLLLDPCLSWPIEVREIP